MIRSLNEFKRRYLPKQYKAEQLAKMSPRELGEWMAKESLKKVAKILMLDLGK